MMQLEQTIPMDIEEIHFLKKKKTPSALAPARSKYRNISLSRLTLIPQKNL